METKLTDFTPEKLAYLEILVEKDWKEITRHIVEMETIFADTIALHENPTYQGWVKYQATASEWLTQIHTARAIVQSRETVNAN